MEDEAKAREDRRLELRRLIEESGLSRQEAADVLSMPKNTLDTWLKPPTSKNSTPVPQMALELFEIKTRGARAKKAKAAA